MLLFEINSTEVDGFSNFRACVCRAKKALVSTSHGSRDSRTYQDCMEKCWRNRRNILKIEKKKGERKFDSPNQLKISKSWSM